MAERETQARWLRVVGVSASFVAVLVVAAPAGGGEAVSSKRAPAMVTAGGSSLQFAPDDVTINQGESVTWTNAGGTHNVVIGGESFEQPSPPAAPGAPDWPVTHTFNTPGTFTYFCRPHQGQGMTGVVRVIATSPPPGGGTPPPPPGGTPPPGGGTPPPGGGQPPPSGGGGGGGGTPGDPSPPGAPGGGKLATTVSLKVSDATPVQGARVRFFGTVKPAQDGRVVQLQRRSRGSFRTIARIKLTDAGSARSKFSKRLRVLGDAVFRARLPADSAHELGMSRARRLDVL